MINKKGAGFSIWTETILFSMGFIAILAIIISSMNLMYGQNYNVILSDRTNSTQLFVKYMNTSQDKLTGGEVSFLSASGVTLKTSWDIMLDMSSIIWSFVTGGWIKDLISGMGLGEAGDVLAVILQILYFISVVFALLYALFRVVL